MRSSNTRRLGALALSLALTLLLGLAPGHAANPAGVVNVNTATAEQLVALPGIGETKARAIVDLRDERGRFDSIEELLDVKGIGPAALEKARPFLTLKGRTTYATP